jgi:hypothetical protein
MHGSRSKIPSKKSRPDIYDVKFLALLGASYIYDISRLRVKVHKQKQQILEPKQRGKLKEQDVLHDLRFHVLKVIPE